MAISTSQLIECLSLSATSRRRVGDFAQKKLHPDDSANQRRREAARDKGGIAPGERKVSLHIGENIFHEPSPYPTNNAKHGVDPGFAYRPAGN